MTTTDTQVQHLATAALTAPIEFALGDIKLSAAARALDRDRGAHPRVLPAQSSRSD